MIYEYKGRLYPEYLKNHDACQYIEPVALKFCKGVGLDVGCGRFPLDGAQGVDIINGGDAYDLPYGEYDYIFSSHCLEHLENPVRALEHWIERIHDGGVLFLYLPHPEMEYWLPQNCRKHLHSWQPRDIVKLLGDLGLVNILHSERDLAWGFAVVGFKTDVEERSAKKQRAEADIAERVHHIIDDPDMLKLHEHFGGGIFHRCSLFHNLNRILLKNGVKGKHALEIGTYNGITAVILARYFDKVTTIDILDCPIKHEVVKFLGINNIEFINIKDNAEKREVVKKLDFDFCYMDGDHENDTLLDYNLVKHCKNVLFHEYWSEQPPVYDLVNSLPEEQVKKFPFMALWRG